ncbi:MAG TPA: vitamin K epoxide reductase family protein [Vicinamibacterales bacterium]|nr:vitamin K epoxide reductase family protein [Vicinamibacterales bacterium]
MSSLARKLLAGFALLGLAASSTALWVHYHLLTTPNYSSFCDVNGTVNCSDAYLSRYGTVGGVPVALFGVLFFAFVLVLVWASRASRPAAEAVAGYLFALSTVGLAVVLYLGYASFFILHAVCLLCVTTYVAVVAVFIISGGASSLPMSSLPRRAARDLRTVMLSPIALAIAVLFVGGSAAAIAMFPRDASAAARSAQQPQAQPLSAAQQSQLARWWDMQEKVNMPFSNDGTKVLVVKFSDFQCPACAETYFAYQGIFGQYKNRPSDLRFVLKHFPLNPECNATVTNMVHPAACAAAAAGVMALAKGQATFDKLEDWFFVNQQKLSPATARQAAADVAGITDYDAQYPRAIQQVKTDASIGGVLGVKSTPTFFINGRRIVGGVEPRVLQAIIDLELSRATAK